MRVGFWWHVLLLCIVTQAHGSSDFQFSEKPGSFAVGFRVVEQYDETRVYLAPTDPATGEPNAHHHARPIQTLIWYPASKAGQPMHYDDYLLLTGSEDRFDRSEKEIRETAEFRLRDYLPPDIDPAKLAAIRQQAMWASRDAQASPGKFPVVIYAPSHNASAAENADVCEYLASHGYVVLASPSIGATTRWMLQTVDDVETQARDIEFLVGYAATLPNADVAHIAVVGYSWGGIANVFAAAKDSRITALVGFDGGIRLVGKLVAEAKYVTPERLTIPYLYLASDLGTLEDLYRQKQDLSDDLLARLKYCDLYLVTVNPLIHYHFASLHLRFASETFPFPLSGEYSLDEIHRAYGWLARYTLAFLDGVSKNDPHGLEFILSKAAANGLPPHAVSIQVTRSVGVAPTRAGLAAEMHRKGFTHAAEIYDSVKANDSDFKLPGSEFGDWIEELTALGRTKDAIEIARLFVRTYPDRPGPYFRLGELQQAVGDKKAATESYRRVLSMQPSDEITLKKLQELEKPSGR